MTRFRPLALRILIIFFTAIVVGNVFGQFMLRRNPSSSIDADGFGELGRRLVVEGNMGGSVRRGPAYPLFVGATYKVFGVGNHSALIFCQSILLGVLGAGAFLMFHAHFRSPGGAFIAGLCVILHPVCVWYVPRLWLELLFANLTLAMIWLACKSLSKPTLWNLVGFGLLAGAASLCKAVTLLFPLYLGCAAFILYLFRANLFCSLTRMDLVKILIAPTIVMLLVISPWVARNRMVSGRWVLISSNLGIEFFRGNTFAEENSFLLQKTIPEIFAIARDNEKRILKNEDLENATPAEIDEVFNPMMWRYIISHPGGFATKIVKQTPTFWMRGETTGKSFAFLFLAVATFVPFIIGFIRLRNTSILACVILIFVIYLNLLYATLLAWARYSMPLYPLMLLIGVWWMLGFFRFGKALKPQP